MKFKFTLVFIFLILFTISCTSKSTLNRTDLGEPSENAINVLFIGNSLINYSKAQEKFKSIAESLDKDVYVGNYAINGMGLKDHAIYSPTINAIFNVNWDYVILQGSSYEVAFPDKHNEIEPPIETLLDYIRQQSEEPKVLFFLDWALLSGYGSYNYENFQNKIYEGTMLMAEKYDLVVAPVGLAWQESMNENPQINLYHQDGSHPSNNGSYLSACVFYSTVFQEKVFGSDFYDVLSEDYAKKLQKASDEIVIKRIDEWYKFIND